MMTIEEFIKVGTVPFGYPRSLGDVALGCLHQSDEILLFKLTPGIRQGGYFFLMLLNCVMQ